MKAQKCRKEKKNNEILNMYVNLILKIHKKKGSTPRKWKQRVR